MMEAATKNSRLAIFILGVLCGSSLLSGILLVAFRNRLLAGLSNTTNTRAWDSADHFADAHSRLRVADTKDTLQIIGNAIHLFNLRHGRVPIRLEELTEKPSDIALKDWPPGGYLNTILLDGWGHEFLYRTPGKNGKPYDLMSLGMDNREGGEGFNADISSDDLNPKK